MTFFCSFINTLRPRPNGCHFADDFFKCIFLNENAWIAIIWLGAVQATSYYLNQWWSVYRRIYASLGLNELIHGLISSLIQKISKLRPESKILIANLKTRLAKETNGLVAQFYHFLFCILSMYGFIFNHFTSSATRIYLLNYNTLHDAVLKL